MLLQKIRKPGIVLVDRLPGRVFYVANSLMREIRVKRRCLTVKLVEPLENCDAVGLFFRLKTERAESGHGDVLLEKVS